MLYIQLFHGRKHPDEQLDDWGETGPTFGPYNAITSTYATDIKMSGKDNSPDILWYCNDLVFYDGMYYGDWIVVETPPESPTQFNDSKTASPMKGHTDDNKQTA